MAVSLESASVAAAEAAALGGLRRWSGTLAAVHVAQVQLLERQGQKRQPNNVRKVTFRLGRARGCVGIIIGPRRGSRGRGAAG